MGVLKTVATFGLVGRSADTTVGVVSLNIVRGSVLDFHPTSSNNTTTTTTSNNHSTVVGAIVNAANEGCLGGGGVDGAINKAGGEELWNDRQALPLIPNSTGIRCHTGGAVVTGPNDYGTLHVPFVVHAVGPNYRHYFTDSDSDDSDDNEQQQQYQLPDQLLRSAYQESLARCREQGITDVAFSLLSAGVFRGTRTVEEVLTIGVVAIRDWYQNSTMHTDMAAVQQGKETTEMETEQKKKGLADTTTTTVTSVNVGVGGDITPMLPSESESKKQVESQQQQQPPPPNPHTLQTITLCGFNEKEVNLLVKVCQKIFRTNDTSSVTAKRPRSP